MNYINPIKATFIVILSMLLISCGGDDEPTTCDSFPTLSGEINIDGEKLGLSVAQRLVQSAGGSFGDQYVFQLAGVSSDCNTQKSISLNMSVPTGESVGGTYAIKSFFDAGDNDATGSFTTQSLNPISQSLLDLTGGSVTIVDNGGNSYEIDLDATVAGGGNVTMSLEHTF